MAAQGVGGSNQLQSKGTPTGQTGRKGGTLEEGS
jgi:hypothetical protein